MPDARLPRQARRVIQHNVALRCHVQQALRGGRRGRVRRGEEGGGRGANGGERGRTGGDWTRWRWRTDKGAREWPASGLLYRVDDVVLRVPLPGDNVGKLLVGHLRFGRGGEGGLRSVKGKRRCGGSAPAGHCAALKRRTTKGLPLGVLSCRFSSSTVQPWSFGARATST